MIPSKANLIVSTASARDRNIEFIFYPQILFLQ